MLRRSYNNPLDLGKNYKQGMKILTSTMKTTFKVGKAVVSPALKRVKKKSKNSGCLVVVFTVIVAAYSIKFIIG